jgi:hypothetical protein
MQTRFVGDLSWRLTAPTRGRALCVLAKTSEPGRKAAHSMVPIDKAELAALTNCLKPRPHPKSRHLR